MNPRPIIVASIIAVLFVVAVYLGSKSVYEGRIEDTKEPTAEKPKGQVDNTPTTPLNDPPARYTNDDKQQTSVTQQQGQDALATVDTE